MWIPRTLEAELPRLAATFPVVALTGPRQVGKTSLLERVFPEHRFVSLDLASTAEMAESRPEDFLAAHPPPVILDEVQHAPGLFRHLKARVDSDRRNGLFLLTGSQGYSLMESLSDSLAGRVAVVPLLGLSAEEWEGHPAHAHLDRWELLWRGGYPGLWAEEALRPGRDRWYQGYVASYLERDVRSLLNVSSLRDFERFLRATALRCGQTLNMSDLARDVGISPSTARQWVSVLVASNQLLLLEPYHRSLSKRLVKSPKLYLTDTGLAAFLTGMTSVESLRSSPLAGALWETHVVNQWLRWRDWTQPAAALWYWRDQAGNEVDLLVEHGGRITPVECKLTEHPGRGDARGIARLRGFYGPETVDRGFVACSTAAPFELTEGVTAVSGWQTWSLDQPSIP